MKTLKRNVDELEEEMQKEKAQKRKAQRECEEHLETQEALNREINSLKTKLRWVRRFRLGAGDWRHLPRTCDWDSHISPIKFAFFSFFSLSPSVICHRVKVKLILNLYILSPLKLWGVDCYASACPIYAKRVECFIYKWDSNVVMVIELETNVFREVNDNSLLRSHYWNVVDCAHH